MLCCCKWYSVELSSGILNISQVPRETEYGDWIVGRAEVMLLLVETGSGACGAACLSVMSCIVMKLSRHNGVS